jgi:hypothetical protein
MAAVEKEERALTDQIETAKDSLGQRDHANRSFATCKALLDALGARLDEPISWEVKREFVEVLVAGIKIDTTELSGAKTNVVMITYKFADTVNTCTGRGSSQRPA